MFTQDLGITPDRTRRGIDRQGQPVGAEDHPPLRRQALIVQVAHLPLGTQMPRLQVLHLDVAPEDRQKTDEESARQPDRARAW